MIRHTLSALAGVLFAFSFSSGATTTYLPEHSAGSWTGSAGAACGTALAGGGDFNGDAYEDLLIGCPGDARGGADSGSVYLILGKPGSFPPLTSLAAGFSLYHGSPGDRFGSSLAWTGDTNGDGFDDFVVGAPGHAAGKGRIFVFFGRAIAEPFTLSAEQAGVCWIGEATGDRLGTALGEVADIDGDALGDITVSAPNHSSSAPGAGATYVVFGRPGMVPGCRSISEADVRFTGAAPDQHSGASVAKLPYLDPDGYGDLVIGVPGSGKTGGSAFYIPGSRKEWNRVIPLDQAGTRIADERGNTRLGWLVASAGDADGDGLGDLLIADPGAPGSLTPEYGRVTLVRRKVEGETPTRDLFLSTVFAGDPQNPFVTSLVTQGRDYDGDGYTDILIGAGDYSGQSPHQGRAYLFFGGPELPTGSIPLSQARVIFQGDQPEDRLGLSVTLTDLNGDGYVDVVAGAPGRKQQAGEVFLFPAPTPRP